MAEFPFKIPESLSAYVEQFEDDSLKMTTKLKNHLNKRGPDAVGYFLLAWFYHLKGVKDEAIKNALKAKIYAPGSPLMEKLHYYLSHSDTFQAWTPRTDSVRAAKYGSGKGPEPILDLDNLIDRLSNVQSRRITIPESEMNASLANKNITEYDIDDIASETLANIHETQGKTEAAIRTYKRLKKLNKEKSDFYGEQISRLEKLREEQDENRGTGEEE